MVFADSDLVGDRLLSTKGKPASITRWIAYAHGIITDILADYDISVSTIDSNTTNYAKLQHAEADIAAGYIYQGNEPTGESSDTRPTQHILVTTGMANARSWAKTYADSLSSTTNPRARVTLRKFHRSYSDNYS